MSDGPAERPRIDVLLLRADWTREPPTMFAAPYTHRWVVADLLEVPHYVNQGYLPIAFDPMQEAAYRAWRTGRA